MSGRLVSLLLLVCYLYSCTLGPVARQPEFPLELPAAWSSDGARLIAEVDTLWWHHLAGEQLAELIQEALVYNHNLAAAATRIDIAHAQARIAGADLLPGVGLSASTARRKRHFVGFPLPSSDGISPVTTSNNFAMDVALAWEVDLWGRLRHTTRAAMGEWQASAADLRGARLSLVGRIARYYVAAVEAAGQVELATAIRESYRLSAARIELRYRQGLGSASDLKFAQVGEAGAVGLLAQRCRRLDAARRQLEILLGRYPASAVEHAGVLPPLPPPTPTGLPAGMLARRPDLAAAERRLYAADARLVAQRRTLLPRISLTAVDGRSSNELNNLLDGDFSVWNLVGNITYPLFLAGRLRAAVDLATAQADQARAVYAERVLAALGEVELALATEVFLASQEQAARIAWTQSEELRILAENRYGSGLIDFIALLQHRRSVIQARSQWLAVQRQCFEARIDLHLSLGGGWADLTAESGTAP